MKKICDIYKDTLSLHEKGVHIECLDEKSGIQAIERAAANLPMLPGSVEKQEHEYIRHGTQVLIGAFEVATGKISAVLKDTRGNVDFLDFVEQRVATDPEAKWVFILDQLNTHKSIDLVRWVAKECNIEDDLGIERRRGVIKSMKTRMDFLSDSTHRIRFIYTPKHRSWMNQIEIWFGILERNLLKRLSTSSIEQLKQKIYSYMKYFNDCLAHPFAWTYKGDVLKI